MFLQHHVLQRVLNYLWFMNGNSCLNKTSTHQPHNNQIETTPFSPLWIFAGYLNIWSLEFIHVCFHVNVWNISLLMWCVRVYIICQFIWELESMPHVEICIQWILSMQSIVTKLGQVISNNIFRVGQTIIQKYRITNYLLMHIYQL